MVEIINQVAGVTKEVAMTYIILYGILEILKLVLTGFITYHVVKACSNIFIKLFESI